MLNTRPMTVLCPWQSAKLLRLTTSNQLLITAGTRIITCVSRVLHMCCTSLPLVPPVAGCGKKFWAVQNFLLRPTPCKSAPNDPKPKVKASGIKTALCMCSVVPWVPHLSQLHSTISGFWDIPHFRFPINSYVKISKCHKIFKTWPIAKKCYSLYFTMVASASDENCGRNSVLKFTPYMVLC